MPRGHDEAPGPASAQRSRRPWQIRLGYRWEIGITVATLALTTAAWILASGEILSHVYDYWLQERPLTVAGELFFLLIVNMLIYGNFVYQLTRLGHYRRLLNHQRATGSELAAMYDGDAPALTILVPSYKEDTAVIRNTLLSAVFQDYPNKRVVLLIDDPPAPVATQDTALLEQARRLPQEITALLAPMQQRTQAAHAAFVARCEHSGTVNPDEWSPLAGLLEECADWFHAQACRHESADDGASRLLRERVLHALRDELRQRCALLQGGVRRERRLLDREYRRLTGLFSASVTSFERKRYVNLSHEPNKAMNLNSYIGLMGSNYEEQPALNGKLSLRRVQGAAAQVIPDSDYLITLDADSLIVPSYATTLIHFMERAENRRFAIAQTPYSTIPAPKGTLEYVAGATTDIQYNIHQGFTAFNATYWVGANALIRKRALEDICTAGLERGYEVTRFVQDRTVIEDTESSIDLAMHGWRLYNYPERLAFSATPPDFGALLIQRRRWANGGLLILPKLIRYLTRNDGQRKRLEGFIRIHYLASIAAVNAGLLCLLALPFGHSVQSLWLPLTALPYFFLYARDLAKLGYRGADLLRVYALNLLLIPVNLGGVLKSLHQAVSGAKIPFGRTPKVTTRTVVPAIYLIAVYGLLCQWLLGAAVDAVFGHWVLACFSLINAAFLGYAIVRYVGLRASGEDLTLAWRNGRLGRRMRQRLRLATARG